jgi:hypothetical protein
MPLYASRYQTGKAQNNGTSLNQEKAFLSSPTIVGGKPVNMKKNAEINSYHPHSAINN